MSTFVTGRSLGLMVCTQCHATMRNPTQRRSLCPRCGAVIHLRKPQSLGVTGALVASAALLYVPANVLPVMHLTTFLSVEDDTILSGVLSLIEDGSWPLAALVFVASIVVPLLKILALGWLVLTVNAQWRGGALPRSKLFRLVEFIGRWSMLDVFAISLLVALVQIHSLATIEVRLGALAFAAVVVLTMLASQSFDERLLWDVQSND